MVSKTSTESTALNGQNWKTKEQIAAYFACDVRTISNWMRRRILPYVKVRSVLRFDLEECDRAFKRFQTKSRFTDPDLGLQPTAPALATTPAPPLPGESPDEPSRAHNLEGGPQTVIPRQFGVVPPPETDGKEG